jgi:hypothetical protein
MATKVQDHQEESPYLHQATDSVTKETTYMTNGSEFDKFGTYQVRVGGTLDGKWANWFDGFTITPQLNDECLLTGQVSDQAALYGLISKIGSIGLPLLSVHRLESEGQSSDEVTREEKR